MTLTAANAHDVKAALPTVVAVPPVSGKRGRPRTRPDALVADKAYDSQDLRTLLRWLGIHPDIPRRGDSSRGLGASAGRLSEPSPGCISSDDCAFAGNEKRNTTKPFSNSPPPLSATERSNQRSVSRL